MMVRTGFSGGFSRGTAGSTPRAALLISRIIWFALLMGQFCFMFAESVVISQAKPQVVRADLLRALLITNIIMLIVIVPVMFMVRLTIFSRVRSGKMRAIAAFSTGNIIFWAGCEGVSFFGLVICLINQSFGPSMIVVAIAIACQIVTFPRRSTLESLTESQAR